MNIDLKNVGARLEKIRAAHNLRKGEFAASFGLDPSSYSKIIKGEKPLLADAAYTISEKWGVTMDYIYRGRLTGLPEDLSKSLRSTTDGSER